jgi:hypothetical protein
MATLQRDSLLIRTEWRCFLAVFSSSKLDGALIFQQFQIAK